MDKNEKPFEIIFTYLKHEKTKLFLYLLLVGISCVPSILEAIVWGLTLEALVEKNVSNFFLYLLLWEGMYIMVYGILKIPKENLYNYLEIKFNQQVTKDLYRKIDNLPAIAFEEIGTGEFINRLVSDPSNVMQLLSKLVRLTCKSVVVIIVLIITFKISWILFAEIIVLGIIMGFIANYYYPKIKKSQEKIKKDTDTLTKRATENISGIREIKALGIKNVIEKGVFCSIDSVFKESKKIRGYEVIYQGLNNITYFLLQIVILATAGYFTLHGRMEYAMFVTLEMYIWRIDEVVESLSDFGVNYNKVKVSLNRINDIINNKLYKDELFGNEELKNPKGVISFKDVYFKYREDEDYTLKGLNLTIMPNKKNSIVGKSGNGKSTVFNLLLRYFDTTNGSVLIDDVDIRNLSEEDLRNNISIIRQNPFVFNMSIKDNLLLVKSDATFEELKIACKKAYIDEYIESLPDKYETIIGEGGVNLSGGQKQRLAIARTLLRNTKIILFDEATSALDNESQEYISETIDDLIKDHTVIIVAHRLSTIMNSDVINVIDDGVLASSGTHKELLKNSKVYKKLYNEETLNS